MTVKELIEALELWDDDMNVIVGIDIKDCKELKILEIKDVEEAFTGNDDPDNDHEIVLRTEQVTKKALLK